MQEGARSEGDEARCLNGSFIARCKKEESQWEERIKTKSNPGMGGKVPERGGTEED